MSSARSGVYRERLRCPWSWYFAGAVAGLVLAPEISFVTPIPVWATALFGVIVAATIVTWIGRSWIMIDPAGTLTVRGARLAPGYVAGVVALNPPTLRRLLGREGDPAAFLAVKPWLKTGVQIVLDDLDDPVPYWLVGTRRPGELAAALAAVTRSPSGGRP